MKIGMIGQKGVPALYGGIERHVDELSQRLAAIDHEVVVYVRRWYTHETQRMYKRVRIVETPTIQSKYFGTISHVFTATIHALFQRYDVIHYHGVGPALLAWIPRIFARRTKVVITFHCKDQEHQKWGRLARFMLRQGERATCIFAHETITVSKSLQSYIRRAYGRDAKYIPNGAMPQKGASASALAALFGIENKKYILAVARFIRHKGLHYVIAAFLQLKARRCMDGKKLVIVGDSFYSAPYKQQLRVLSENDPDIIFTGWQHGDVLHGLFSHAYLYIQASESEGLSLSVIEAASYGTPVLVSDIPENLEATEGYGFRFKNKSLASLRARLRSLLKTPYLLEERSARGKDHVARCYSWDDIARQTAGLYARLLAEKELKVYMGIRGLSDYSTHIIGK